jgi:hypothetical protein
MPDQPEDARGPRVFSYLDPAGAEGIPTAERDELALALRAAYDAS